MRKMKIFRAASSALLVCMVSIPAAAANTDSRPEWDLVVGPGAYHWSNDEKHSHVVLLGLERFKADGSLFGFSVFNNSFGQPSAYAYYGHTWNDVCNVSNVYFKLSGGVIYGYKGEHKDGVPFNHHGFGLGLIPGLGYRLTPKDSVQVNVLGTAAAIFTYNRRL
jgi:hypothetical protein